MIAIGNSQSDGVYVGGIQVAGGVENKFSLEDTYNLGVVINLTNDTVPLYYDSDGNTEVIELAPTAVFVARVGEYSAAYCTVDSGTYKFDCYRDNTIVRDSVTGSEDLFAIDSSEIEYKVAIIKSKI